MGTKGAVHKIFHYEGALIRRLTTKKAMVMMGLKAHPRLPVPSSISTRIFLLLNSLLCAGGHHNLWAVGREPARIKSLRPFPALPRGVVVGTVNL